MTYVGTFNLFLFSYRCAKIFTSSIGKMFVREEIILLQGVNMFFACGGDVEPYRHVYDVGWHPFLAF